MKTIIQLLLLGISTALYSQIVTTYQFSLYSTEKQPVSLAVNDSTDYFLSTKGSDTLLLKSVVNGTVSDEILVDIPGSVNNFLISKNPYNSQKLAIVSYNAGVNQSAISIYEISNTADTIKKYSTASTGDLQVKNVSYNNSGMYISSLLTIEDERYAQVNHYHNFDFDTAITAPVIIKALLPDTEFDVLNIFPQFYNSDSSLVTGISTFGNTDTSVLMIKHGSDYHTNWYHSIAGDKMADIKSVRKYGFNFIITGMSNSYNRSSVDPYIGIINSTGSLLDFQYLEDDAVDNTSYDFIPFSNNTFLSVSSNFIAGENKSLVLYLSDEQGSVIDEQTIFEGEDEILSVTLTLRSETSVMINALKHSSNGQQTANIIVYGTSDVLNTRNAEIYTSLSIWPNPARGYVYLAPSTNGFKSADSWVSLYNTSGVLMLKQQYNPLTPVDLSKIPRGAYIIRLSNNRFMATEKIMLY